MDEKFIQALGGSVDAGFVSILRQSTMPKKEEKVKPVQVGKSKSRRRKSPGFGRKMKGGKSPLKAGEITWIEHVRLTAGANQGMCWKDAMRKASGTWRRY
jgi:hypothetical protein